MKVQCDVCQQAEATVLCCADEAALCRGCDEDVHAANKLAGKHRRVPLLHPSPSQIPSCDICQEKAGYFFCLEDRALLCRQCDVGVHTAKPPVTAHQRFLVTGVRVAPQECAADNNNNNSSSSSTGGGDVNSGNRNSSNPEGTATTGEAAAEAAGTSVGPEENQLGGFQKQWEWSEILAGSEFEQCYGFPVLGFSTAAGRR